jgi:hypothetical protein
MIQINYFIYIKSNFIYQLNSFFNSKQYSNQSKYFCNTIKKSFEKKLLFEFSIVILIATLMIRCKILIQYQTKNSWCMDSFRSYHLCHAIYNIQSSYIVPSVYKYIFTLIDQTKDLFLSYQSIFFMVLKQIIRFNR